MMMETVFDPYDLLLPDGIKSPNVNGLLFTDEVMLSDFTNDSSSISPTSNNVNSPEDQFDPIAFEAFLNDLISTESSLMKEQSVDLPLTSVEAEPATREMGTDPMESISTTQPITITAANLSEFTNAPIFLIRTTGSNSLGNTLQIQSVPMTLTTTLPTENVSLQYDGSPSTVNDYQMEDHLPLTPSSSSNDSPDENISGSPDGSADNLYSKMLTNFDTLPTSGTLVLTNEEIKLIKQEGYQVPTKLPLNKTEEKLLKKIRRKIKNKISAQESRRKKKEYIDALEKQIAQYVDENNALKERMATIEKNQKSLARERDVLRSMLAKGTPGPSTALMVFAVFFAVLFGIWSPISKKMSIDDRALSLENAFIPSNNYQSAFQSRKSVFEQSESTPASYLTDNHKSRVLLSVDDQDHHHHHGPHLPSKNKYHSSAQQQSAAPGYTFPSSVEKYMNKNLQSKSMNDDSTNGNDLKRAWTDDNSIIFPTSNSKKIRFNAQRNANFVVVEENNEMLDAVSNESTPVKIIRVERTIPPIGNDTLKLAQQAANQ